MDRIRKAIGRKADADRPPAASDSPDLASPDGTAEAQVEVPAPNIFVGQGIPPAALEGAEADDAAATKLEASQADEGSAAASEPSWGWVDEFALKGNNSSFDAERPPDGPGVDAQLAAADPAREYPNLTFYIPPTDDQTAEAMIEPHLEPPAAHQGPQAGYGSSETDSLASTVPETSSWSDRQPPAMIEEELSSEAPAGDEAGALGIDPTSVWLKSGISTGKPDEAAARHGGAEAAGSSGAAAEEPAIAAASTPAPGWSDITLKEGHLPILEPSVEEQTVLAAPPAGTDISAWSFQDAYPIKWEGPGFDQPDSPAEAATGEPADTAPEAEKLEAYDYPGEYAQRFDGVDDSGTGDGQPDLIAGTGAAGAAGGQGGGIFGSGPLTLDDSTLGQSADTVPNDETLAIDGTTTESGTREPGVDRSQDSGRTLADDDSADDDSADDDEPVALADLRSEGSRPLSDTAPPPEEVADLPEADEPADLDEPDA